MSDLSVSSLTKSFPTPTEPLVVLDQVSMELNLGENVAVIGPSGSGKSTLLHILGTLDAPTSGQVELLETNPFALGQRELAHFRNQNIGFVFQEHHLLPQLTALENVLVPAMAEGRADASAQERAESLLSQVGLGDRMTHRPGQLSGGERQRVAVARAMLHEPPLLLADEPTGSLDSKNSEQIGVILLQMQEQENVMLVCVTHNEALASKFSRRLRLAEGALIDESK